MKRVTNKLNDFFRSLIVIAFQRLFRDVETDNPWFRKEGDVRLGRFFVCYTVKSLEKPCKYLDLVDLTISPPNAS